MTHPDPDNVHAPSWGGLNWSPWLPLDASATDFRRVVSAEPGLYRVRSPQLRGLVYLGQTGRNLRERTRGLARNTCKPADAPPWNDPHTAAPGLWAWRMESGFTYEVSAAPCSLEKAERLCQESALLYLHRLELGESTLCNHGRFHPLWTRPSNRGQGVGMVRLDDGTNPASGPSLAPAVMSGTPGDPHWLGLPWSDFRPLSEGGFPAEAGVYRIMEKGRIVYLGESGDLAARLRSHRRTFAPGALASVVELPGVLPYQLKERECDLIGAHYLQAGCPAAQWGRKG